MLIYAKALIRYHHLSQPTIANYNIASFSLLYTRVLLIDIDKEGKRGIVLFPE